MYPVFEKIVQLFIQLGIGSLIGVLLGMIFQYFISKKIKIFETKLIIFRRVYKQLYYFILMNQEKIQSLDDSTNGIRTIRVTEDTGLDPAKDLGDILFYTDGDLQKKIGGLIYNIYQESAVTKSNIDDIEYIMSELKKLINFHH